METVHNIQNISALSQLSVFSGSELQNYKLILIPANNFSTCILVTGVIMFYPESAFLTFWSPCKGRVRVKQAIHV